VELTLRARRFAFVEDSGSSSAFRMENFRGEYRPELKLKIDQWRFTAV
jgi:hypothetical protein